MTQLAMAEPSPPSIPDSPVPPHPLPHGAVFFSPGCHFTYRVIGPCCRLFDREQLPWPCCRLQWRGKEPSWRRIGKRFVPDLGTKRHPSYSVEIIGQSYGPSDGQSTTEPTIITLYPVHLPPAVRAWWHDDKPLSPLLSPPLAVQMKEA